MISVALTTYNGEKYILKQLESIYKQSRSVDEVIICDDCSTDRTVALVEKYILDKNLKSWKIIKNDENLGYCKNFFKAVNMCNGEFIFLSDQDDVWHEEKVQLMIKKMNEESNILAISTNYVVIDEKGIEKKTVRLTERENALNIKKVASNSIIKGCTMCIRKELDRLLKHDDLNLRLQLGHDWYYNFLAALAGKNIQIPKELLYYRIHGENISLERNRRKTALATSKENRVKIFEESIKAMETVVERYEEIAPIDEKKKKDIYLMIGFNKIRKEFVEGKYEKVFVLLRKIKYYRNMTFNWKDALHTYVSDIMYAFNINWRIK